MPPHTYSNMTGFGIALVTSPGSACIAEHRATIGSSTDAFGAHDRTIDIEVVVIAR